jgi:diguanylate cyclase (GGDEF)-like protein
MPAWARTVELAALGLLVLSYALLWQLRREVKGGLLLHAGILTVVFAQVWLLLNNTGPLASWHLPHSELVWSASLIHSIGVVGGLVCVALGFYRMVGSLSSTSKRLEQTVGELEEANVRLAELSTTDELTKVYNYRFLMERLRIELSVAVRQEMPLSCAIVDIDDFKKVNDQFGHHHGDKVLERTAAVVRTTLRPSDTVARMGGDEFAVLLPGTDYDTVILVAERVRRAVEAENLVVHGTRLRVTVSIGAASFPEETVTDGRLLLKLADHALYRAKEQGRNRTCLHKDLRRV